MIDDRDESLFHRAAQSLRVRGARDDEALDELLTNIRREATDGIGDDGLRSRSLLTRRRPLMTRGAVRFVAGPHEIVTLLLTP